MRLEQTRLRELRADLWDEHDAPALEQAVALARTFDPSPEASLARRYESANALELHRHLADFHRARRDTTPHEDAAPNERQDGQDCAANSEDQEVSASDPGALPASQGRFEGVGERRENGGRPPEESRHEAPATPREGARLEQSLAETRAAQDPGPRPR